MARMLRILSAAALLAVVVAGCGGAARTQRSAFHGVPRSLAQDWEGRATAIANAAAAGDNCRALQLANSLRTEVMAKEHELPLRLQTPLLVGVNSLAGRIRCTPVPTETKAHTAKPPPEPKPTPHPRHKPHDDKGHGKRHDK